MSSVLDVTDDSFERDVLKSSLPALVHFRARWCGPSRNVASVLDEIAKEYAGRVRIYYLDFDENPIIPREYDIRSIPAVVLFKNGVDVETIVGSAPKSNYVNSLTKHLEPH